MRLANKVAVVAGSAGGMGETEARLFAQEGARVVVADVLEQEGEAVVAAITQAGGEAVFTRLDMTSEEDWQETIGTAVARFGRLDLHVNNSVHPRMMPPMRTSVASADPEPTAAAAYDGSSRTPWGAGRGRICGAVLSLG